MGGDSAQALEPGADTAVATADQALSQIPFEPAGSFPHGEHRRIDCRTCHEDPPGHGSHASVSCTECHGVPAEYGTLPIRSRTECMSCHHDPDGTGECSRCHATAPREVLTLQATLRMSVWSNERTRPVSFDHQLHRELECGTCHGEPPENAVTRGCASCHDRHHEPEARCRSCHEPREGPHHGQAVHSGCGGAGCHQDPVVTALPASRSLCLVCHSEQSEHHAGQVCTTCHFLTGVTPSSPPAGERP